MAILTGLFRIGRDAEVRFTPGGDAVASLALVYNYGKKQDDGNRPSQWIDAVLWGKQAEGAAPYLLKGSQIDAIIDGIHIETYQAKDGTTGAKLVGRVMNFEFAGSKGQQQSAPQPAAQSHHHTQKANGYQPQKAPASSAYNAAPYDDDIPFNSLNYMIKSHLI